MMVKMEEELRQIEIHTAATLDTIKGRVHELLVLKPATRSSDAILQLEYLKRYSNVFVYDASDRLIEFRNKKGITYEEYEQAFKVFESIRRVRQKLQEEAFYRIENGSAKPEDHLICPSERVAARRVIRQGEVRKWTRGESDGYEL